MRYKRYLRDEIPILFPCLILYWGMVFLTSAGCSFFEFFRCINGKKRLQQKMIIYHLSYVVFMEFYIIMHIM